MSPQQIQAAIEQAKKSGNRAEMKRLQTQLQQMLDADSVEEMAIDRMKVGNKFIESAYQEPVTGLKSYQITGSPNMQGSRPRMMRADSVKEALQDYFKVFGGSASKIEVKQVDGTWKDITPVGSLRDTRVWDSIQEANEGEDLYMIKDTEGTKMHAIGKRKEIAAKWAKIKQSRGVTETSEPMEEAPSVAARFKQKVQQAQTAMANGRQEKAKAYLKDASSFLYGIPSTEMSKVNDAYAAYKALKKILSSNEGNFKIKDDMVGVARRVTENAQQFEIEYEISEPSGEKSSGKTKYKGIDQNAAKQRFMDDNKGKNVTVKSVKLVTEAVDPKAKLEKQIVSLEKKVAALRDRLGLARERRRASGKSKGVQGQAEMKIQSNIDAIQTEIAKAKQELKALASAVSSSEEKTVQEANEGEADSFSDYGDWRQSVSKHGAEIYAMGAASGKFEARTSSGVVGEFDKSTSSGWLYQNAARGTAWKDKAMEAYASAINKSLGL